MQPLLDRTSKVRANIPGIQEDVNLTFRELHSVSQIAEQIQAIANTSSSDGLERLINQVAEAIGINQIAKGSLVDKDRNIWILV